MDIDYYCIPMVYCEAKQWLVAGVKPIDYEV